MKNTLFDRLNFNIIIVECVDYQHQSEPEVLIKYINDPACRLLGYDSEELENASINVISGSAYNSGFWRSEIRASDKNRQDNLFECELISKKNILIPVLISLSPLSTNDPKSNRTILFIQNLSAIKRDQEKLSLMQKAVEQTANAVLITDPDGCIEYVNPKFTELTGYSADELIGKNPRILQSGFYTPEFYQAFWQLLETTGKWHGEIKNKKKDGTFYWAYESISTIKNDQGEITHLLAIEEDISQRKLAESALQESEQRFRQMAEMTGEWLWEQSPDGYYIYSSVAVKSILGFTPEEIIGKHYTELLTSIDKEKQLHFSIIHQPFYSLTNIYQHRDGHKVITESTGLPIKDASGKLIKWRGVDRDITERKSFEEALVESEKRKRLIIESALNSIVIMDSFGIITDWNIQAERMFGWTRDEAINQRLDELIIPPRFRKAHRQGLENFLRSGQGPLLNTLIEQTAIRRNGREFPVELSISPLKLGNTYIFSGFIHDISARKKAEKTIREAQVKMAITRSEMKIAHQIQSSLLPSKPIQSDDFEVTGYCLPADQVGGDYYDYFFSDENNLDMVIADVSGHSIGPALFMVEARSSLRTQANRQADPAETLSTLNNLLYKDLNNADYFITMFYLQFNISKKILSYANAGHPTPLFFDNYRKRCTHLDAEGMIFGVRKNIVYEENSTSLASGDMILLYTDGLIEAENNDGEFFGKNRVCDIFSQNAQHSPHKIIGEILRQLKLFCHCDTFKDDITLMIFKRS